MFILDIKEKAKGRQVRKSMLAYLGISMLLIVMNKVYGIFGHGVTSDYMTWMFSYPLIGGTLLYGILELRYSEIPKFHGYRLFTNIYNSGIAMLVSGSFMKGIFEIAGTNSSYLIYYFIGGWSFVAAGSVTLIVLLSNYKLVSVENQRYDNGVLHTRNEGNQ